MKTQEELKLTYDAEYGKFLLNMSNFINNLPLCYFERTVDQELTSFNINNKLILNKKFKINPTENKLETIYSGYYKASLYDLSVEIAPEGAENLYKLVEKKISSYTKESLVQEQNVNLIEQLEKINKSFEELLVEENESADKERNNAVPC